MIVIFENKKCWCKILLLCYFIIISRQKNVNKADTFSTFIWIYYNGKILRYIIIIGIRHTIFTKMYFVARLKYTHGYSNIINFTTLVFIGNIAAFNTLAFCRYILCFLSWTMAYCLTIICYRILYHNHWFYKIFFVDNINMNIEICLIL